MLPDRFFGPLASREDLLVGRCYAGASLQVNFGEFESITVYS
jgi:hypothetical protein